MRYYFTADTHFGHGNIIRYTNRPMLKSTDLDEKGNWVSPYIANKRTQEMDKMLIRNWNQRIKDEDTVFVIGDFCFNKSTEAPKGNVFDYYKGKLNGNIVFIRGNHDKSNKNKSKITSLVINIGNQFINLTHNPAHADERFKINLTGHVHNNWKIKRIKKGFSFTDCINVGVDVCSYFPITYEEIEQRYTAWKKKEVK